MTVEEIVRQTLAFPAAHVVLTGGEPMAAREMPLLAVRLREHGKHLTIETAGHLAARGHRLRPGVDQPQTRQLDACARDDLAHLDRTPRTHALPARSYSRMGK